MHKSAMKKSRGTISDGNWLVGMDDGSKRYDAHVKIILPMNLEPNNSRKVT